MRALFAFNAGSLPAGAQVTGAALTLHAWRTGANGTRDTAPAPIVSLYKQGSTGTWDEGDSTGGLERGTSGDQGPCGFIGDAAVDRATYAASNAATLVSGATVTVPVGENDFTITSAAMASDVQGWKDVPTSNNGWSIRLANESLTSGVSIAARETTQTDASGKTLGPRLLVTYRKAKGQTCSTPADCGSGVCVGGVCCSAACAPSNAQCQTAACTAGTGACVITNKPGTPSCNDNKSCTANDVCTNGLCGGTLSCPAPPACKGAGSCAANGTCAYTMNLAANTVCNDGNAATMGETCDGLGNCIVRNLPLGAGCATGTQCASTFCVNKVCCGAMACTPGNAQCQSATCQVGTGQCVVTNQTGNCTDNNLCTTGDICSAGACSHSGAVTCAAPTTCQNAGVCQPASGVCSYTLKAPGTPCNDNNAATTGEQCDTGGNCAVPPNAWSAAVTLDSSSFGSFPFQGLQAAVAPGGDALATWLRANTSGTWVGYFSVAASRFSHVSSTWAGPTVLNLTTRPVTDGPRVAVDGSANGTVLWDDWDPTFLNTTVWSLTSSAAGVWGSAVSPEAGQPLGAIAQSGITAGGTVFGVWASGDNSNTSLRVPHWGTLASSGAWSAPKLFSTPGLMIPLLAFDAQNNAMAVWAQSDSGRFNPYWSRFNGTAWTTPARLDVPQAGTGVSNVQVVVASNGNAVAAWIENDSATSAKVIARTFTPAGGWAASTVTVGTIPSGTGGFSLAMNPAGDSIGCLQYQDSANTWQLTSYAAAGAAFGTPIIVQSQAKTKGFFGTALAIEASGTATLATLSVGTGIKVQRLPRGATAWSAPVAIDTDTAQFTVNSLSFAMSPNGQGVIAWVRSPVSGTGLSTLLASTLH